MPETMNDDMPIGCVGEADRPALLAALTASLSGHTMCLRAAARHQFLPFNRLRVRVLLRPGVLFPFVIRKFGHKFL